MSYKIATIGGGNGIFRLLRGLRESNADITAITPMSDDGGSSGILRREYGILPPGDFLKNLIAISNLDNRLLEIFGYRYGEGKNGEGLSPHMIGNVFLAALQKTSASIDDMVETMNDFFKVNKGYNRRVLPASVGQDICLVAEKEDGTIVYGEFNIGDKSSPIDHYSPIKRLYLREQDFIYPDTRKSLLESDLIVLGPGSLYTSIGASLVVDGVKDALQSSKAENVYVLNLVTQFPETYKFSASDHIRVVSELMGQEPDYIVVDETKVPDNIKEELAKDKSEPVRIDVENIQIYRSKILRTGGARYLPGKDRIRAEHDSHALANVLLRIVDKNGDCKPINFRNNEHPSFLDLKF